MNVLLGLRIYPKLRKILHDRAVSVDPDVLALMFASQLDDGSHKGRNPCCGLFVFAFNFDGKYGEDVAPVVFMPFPLDSGARIVI